MKYLNLSAAYQGTGWRARFGSLRQDIKEGKYWLNYKVNTEWNTLNAVIVHVPNANILNEENPNDIQHLESIDFNILNSQLKMMCNCYKKMGIKVHFITLSKSKKKNSEEKIFYNLMYVRDLFFMTPEGAIISRMGSSVRAGEERHIAASLSKLGIPIIHTIGGSGTFEGADALWVNGKIVIVGVGNRTNNYGYKQIKECLNYQGVEVKRVVLPSKIQHLLGVLQIIDKDLAIVRVELISKEFKILLQQLGLQLIELYETYEVCLGQAMNFVTIGSRKIIMVGNNPETRNIYEKNGIEIAGEIELNELLKGAGGLGCATGILNRSEFI